MGDVEREVFDHELDGGGGQAFLPPSSLWAQLNFFRPHPISVDAEDLLQRLVLHVDEDVEEFRLLALWDVATRQELLTFSGVGSILSGARWSADGDAILTGGPWQAWRAPFCEEISTVEKPEKGSPLRESYSFQRRRILVRPSRSSASNLASGNSTNPPVSP